jgi:non-heme chloroperoxidase
MPQGVMGGARAHYDSVVASSQTDFNKQGHRHASLIMHGHDDKIVAYADSAPYRRRC